MTLKQGQEINNQFSTLSDSIKNINALHNQYMLNNSYKLQRVYESYLQEYYNHNKTRAEADSFKTMYLANKKIYIAAEEEHRKLRVNSIIFSLTAFFITIFVTASK